MTPSLWSHWTLRKGCGSPCDIDKRPTCRQVRALIVAAVKARIDARR